MKNRLPAFAVVRVDVNSVTGVETDWLLAITVKEVVASQAEAEAEVIRLNALNGEKGCVYFSTNTRLSPKALLASNER